MKFEETVVLLPCQTLEDLTLDRPSDEADELLAAWCAPFHPILLDHVGCIPRWERAEAPPEGGEGFLVILPGCSEKLLPSGWLAETEQAGTHIIRGFGGLDEASEALLHALGKEVPRIDPDAIADFHALAFCFFQVELVTRQLRYMSSLDEGQLQTEALAAAEAVLKGDMETTREHLQSGFDLLAEGREYFYPVEARLIDLTLVAPSTIGPSLDHELSGKVATNLLISGETLDQMARKHPGQLEKLRRALTRDSNPVEIIGGEGVERELPLLSPEPLLAHFRRGLACYEKHLGRRPTIFGRRRFGLTPILPQILTKLGFLGVCHFTLEEGHFPRGNQSKITWQGCDVTTLEALARIPVDAGSAAAFLRLPETLGDVMDLDHSATVVFAHWPHRASPWYELVKRMHAFSPVLGSFEISTTYFEETALAGQTARYDADSYRSPYLRQAIEAKAVDPISRWVRYHRRHATAEAARHLGVMADLIEGKSSTPFSTEFGEAIEDACAIRKQDDHAGLDTRLNDLVGDHRRRLAEALSGKQPNTEPGYLVTWPWSFPRRMNVDVSDLAELPAVEGAVVAAEEVGQRKIVTVEVPAMGFVWIGSKAGATQGPPSSRRPRWLRRKKSEPPLAEENVLRNEFFEVTLDTATGAIRALGDYHSRGNRLAQQVALRLPGNHPQCEANRPETRYTIMAADGLSVTRSDAMVGEIVTRGRLVDRNARRLAGFSQKVRARRGSRVLELEVTLEADHEPGPDPWDSYYAIRLAWGDATVDRFRSVGLMSHPSDTTRLEAPHFIDLRAGKTRTTVLTGGLPYHRRWGLRKLDTILSVRGETERTFRLGIGIDLAHPVPASLEWLAPDAEVFVETSPAPATTSGWLFHLGAKNVVATWWEPVVEAERIVGFRARLLETEGRRCRAGLRSFRALHSAHTTDFEGRRSSELPVEDDRVTVEIGAHQWMELECRFL